ncbi:MAG: SDR family NAD(P)-dependent oxidoreductase, partial [Bacteroidota bacterium]
MYVQVVLDKFEEGNPPSVDMDFHDTNFIIIGGTSGMGQSVALALKAQGAHLVVVGLSAEDCSEMEDQLAGQGLALCGDATEPATIAAAIKKAHGQFGAITGLFHVAGGSGRRWGDGPLD